MKKSCISLTPDGHVLLDDRSYEIVQPWNKDSWVRINNIFFYSQLMNGPNKLERYITLGWKDLQVKNTLVY